MFEDKPIRFHLRVDESNSAHVRFTVFENGANCGQLTMTPSGYSALGWAMLIGSLDIRPKTSVQIDTFLVKPQEG